jgi:hypothetical protein
MNLVGLPPLVKNNTLVNFLRSIDPILTKPLQCVRTHVWTEIFQVTPGMKLTLHPIIP